MLTIFTIILAAIINFGIGMLWYNTFGEQWASAYGYKKEELMPDQMQFIQSACVSLSVAIGLAYVISSMGITSTVEGLLAGFLTCLFLVVSTQYSGVIWNKKPMNAFFVEAGCNLVSFTIVGGFIGALF
jgi:hypothetical protein